MARHWNRRCTGITKSNSVGNTRRIACSVNLARRIHHGSPCSSTNTISLTREKRPRQLRSSAIGRNDQSRHLRHDRQTGARSTSGSATERIYNRRGRAGNTVDGKNDDGEDLPAGKYRARGYLVSALKVEDLSQVADSPPQGRPDASVKLKLIPNPLANNKRPTIEIAAGFENDGSYLKTADGLPLFTVNESPNVTRALAATAGEKSIQIWQEDGTGSHRFRISNVDKMMAFDCGEIELK